MTRIAIGLTLSAALVIPDFDIRGPGYLSFANPGVLERVAERRLANGWGLETNWTGYEVLGATADCSLLGRGGWLIAGGEVVPILIVDCEADVHRGQMAERGLLADVSRLDLVHQKGWLVLR